MMNFKENMKDSLEKLVFSLIILFIIIHGIVRHDSIQALISAVCGITYTVFAGKGYPFCYLFGVTGSGFYSYLSLVNSLWGNLLLYLGYYVPMQILGFFKWQKNLKQGEKKIIKTQMTKKEFWQLVPILSLLFVITYLLLVNFKDSHPILDGLTTVLSLGGMYLTVKRCIEQWLFWFVVNLLSLIMWLNVALSGGRVWSTVFMWAVYLILAVYFYFDWRKEINSQN